MENKSILLSKSDHKFLQEHLAKAVMKEYNKTRLVEEVKNAQIFEDSELPDNVVALYTEASIESTNNAQQFTFKLVKPKEANIKLQKVSIFAPISIALWGYQTGDLINWEMPDGVKEFKIMTVRKLTEEEIDQQH